MRMKQLEEYLHNRFDSSSKHASEVEYRLTERIRELENDVKKLKNSLKFTKNTDNKNPKPTKYAENVKHDVMVKQLKWAKNEEY